MVLVLTAVVNMRGVVNAVRQKSMRLLLALGLAVVTLSWSAHALALSAMNETEIRDALFGRTLNGEYQDGQFWTERFNTDNSSDYIENGVPVRGTMQFKNGYLCFSYPAETQQTGGCFEVWRRSTNCFDFYGTTDLGGPAAPLSYRRFGQGWTARAWFADQKSTCISDQVS
ncbi:MAG: hypothetical protein AAFU56_01780 [Pseudomonadota bacterium]